MKREKVPPINAGSMADVAFLLLIFFLVTTTIQTEAGVPSILPPWSKNNQLVFDKNVLTIRLQQTGALQIEEQPATLTELPRYLDQFLENVAHTKAIVHLKHDERVDYATYLAVYDVVKANYKARWNARAKVKHGRLYDDLPLKLQQPIQQALPLVFAETQWTNAQQAGSDINDQ